MLGFVVMGVESVRVVFTKWGGGQHWESVGRVLGEDECGTWVGGDRGRRLTRPGHDVVIPYGTAMLVPADSGFVACFNEPLEGPDAARCSTYVDITTVPRWCEGIVTMVDLDLDVVKRWSGEVEVHDEDEFVDHQVSLGYPAEIVALAQRSCADVRRALGAGDAPYDGRAAAWLERLTEPG